MKYRRELLAEELDELKEFAKVEGRKWKSIMMYEYWMRGIPVKDKNGKEYNCLYRLRNDLGPTWLDEFKLPKE